MENQTEIMRQVNFQASIRTWILKLGYCIKISQEDFDSETTVKWKLGPMNIYMKIGWFDEKNSD